MQYFLFEKFFIIFYHTICDYSKNLKNLCAGKKERPDLNSAQKTTLEKMNVILFLEAIGKKNFKAMDQPDHVSRFLPYQHI